eukprot:1892045-Alexandrium_andersonii.AAC.1
MPKREEGGRPALAFGTAQATSLSKNFKVGISRLDGLTGLMAHAGMHVGARASKPLRGAKTCRPNCWPETFKEPASM